MFIFIIISLRLRFVNIFTDKKMMIKGIKKIEKYAKSA